MTEERFIELMESETEYDRTFEGCRILAGLVIITKYLPKIGIEAVEHDIIYSAGIEELIEAGITEEEVITLRKLNWMINDEGLAHFV